MNLKNFSKALVAIVLLATFGVACNNTEMNKYPGFAKTDNGLFYKFSKRGDDTVAAKEGDKITAYMSYRTMDDSVFMKTREGMPFEIPMMKSTYRGDVFEALGLMHVGDSATFIINSDSFFMKTVGAPRPELLDSGSNFYLDVYIEKIMTPEQMDKERMEKGKIMAEKEKSIIADYIASNKLNVSADPSGIFFVKTKKGKGKDISAGSFAKIHIVAKVIGAQANEFINTYKEGKPIDIEVGTGQLGIGFETGLMKMKVGDKATMIVPFNLAFGAQGMQGYVAPFSTIVYDVEVLGLTSKDKMMAERKKEEAKAEASEIRKMKKYIADNNISVAPTSTGLYYIEEEVGTGKQAIAGKKVKVNYTGYLLDGSKFDSSEGRGPFEFTLGQGQVIPGWDEGIALMKEGGKAKLVIPSKLAYGPRGYGKTIPPNSSLVFDVELIEVED